LASTACYEESFISLYVDDVHTSQEAHIQASTACYEDTSQEAHIQASTACFEDTSQESHIQAFTACQLYTFYFTGVHFPTGKAAGGGGCS
jgi:hypothetical protein